MKAIVPVLPHPTFHSGPRESIEQPELGITVGTLTGFIGFGTVRKAGILLPDGQEILAWYLWPRTPPNGTWMACFPGNANLPVAVPLDSCCPDEPPPGAAPCTYCAIPEWIVRLELSGTTIFDCNAAILNGTYSVPRAPGAETFCIPGVINDLNCLWEKWFSINCGPLNQAFVAVGIRATGMFTRELLVLVSMVGGAAYQVFCGGKVFTDCSEIQDAEIPLTGYYGTSSGTARLRALPPLF